MNNEKENELDKLLKKISLTEIQKKVIEYNNKEKPIAIYLVDGTIIDVIELMPSVQSTTGRAWINIFNELGRYERVNEDHIMRIEFNHTGESHVEEFNKLVDDAIEFNEYKNSIKVREAEMKKEFGFV